MQIIVKTQLLPTRMEAVVQRLMKRQQLRNQVRKQRRQQRITIVRTANLQTIHMEVMDLEIIMLWIYLAMSLKQQRRNSSKTEKTTTSKKNNSGNSNKNDDGWSDFY